MCVDNTDLNKHFPKDSYSLPDIDKLVGGSSGYRYLSLMDAYLGYNQVPFYLDEYEKMNFMTEKANYYFKVMPFGLRNASTTYQRMMKKVFEKQIGQNLEVYMDDMILKSNTLE